MTGVLIKQGEETQTHTGKRPCADGGRDWSAVSISQGTPRNAGSHRKLQEARKDSLLEPPEGARP